MSSIVSSYKSVLSVVKKKPTLLWGLSLLGNLIVILVCVLCPCLPIVSLPIALIIEASLAVIYLKGLKGEGVSSKDLFKGFSNWKHVAGGMLWMTLWIFIWCLIPIAGIVFGIIKAYEYAFTPYILMTRPEIDAMDALKESKKLTKGFKGKMFGAEAIIIVCLYAVILILGLFSAIPYIGSLFLYLMILVVVVIAAFAPLFFGLLRANFYELAINPHVEPVPAPTPAPIPVAEPAPAPSAPDSENQSQEAPGAPTDEGGEAFCPNCGSGNDPQSNFCRYCGTKLK